MYIRVIGKEIEFFRGKDIILFGGGSCGLRALEEFEKSGAHILAFCDNNRTLEGTMLKGYPILAPDKLAQFPEACIIISSTYEEEIEDQLIAMGVTNYYRIKLGVLREVQSKESFFNHVISNEEVNQKIMEGLTGNEPFFLGRLGSVELECLCHYLYFLNRRENRQEMYPENVKMMMTVNAGFFPGEDSLLDQFSERYLSGLANMDFIWSMWFSAFENQLYHEFFPEKMIADYDKTVFPSDQKDPWTAALKDKKILVIHPFEESIRRNYENRKKLFDNQEFLPDFELITLKAVQSIAGNPTEFSDWFEALASMQKQINDIDFDIALIGAGAYGLPLGDYIKGLGKKAIHIGGILQLFFGIKGKAWNKLGVYNEFWTSPLESEIPEDYKKVEAGRYW